MIYKKAEIKEYSLVVNFKKKLSKLYIFFKSKYLIFFFVSFYYLYYLSLEKCYLGIDKCGLKSKWIKTKVLQLFISSEILTFLTELIFYNLISKKHFIHIIIIFMIFYKYSHGKYFEDHGYFNFIFFMIIYFISLIVFLPINIFIYLVKYRNKKILLLVFIIFFFIFCIYNNYIKKYLNCEDWDKGLNNTYIHNDINIYNCQIVLPKTCSYKIYKYFLDRTKLEGIKCKNREVNEKEMLINYYKDSPYISKNTTSFGIPITKNAIQYSYNEYNFTKYVKSHVIDMNNISIIKNIDEQDMPEIKIDFNNNSIYGEMIINLYFNKNLSKQRKKLEENSIPYSSNILVLFFDSVSRANSIRQLKKTLQFFEQFMNVKGRSNPKYPKENFHSFQFFKYYAHTGYTHINYARLFYGKHAGENILRLTYYLKKIGYITGYANDFCYRDNTITFHNITINETYDHQMTICDPNKIYYLINRVKCLYGKTNIDFLYEYANQFWRNYKNNRKFLNIVANDAHEGSLEVLKYYDDIIYTFLNNLYNDNLLEKTSILLVSDHGCAMPSLYYMNDFYQIESYLPMLYMIVNDRKDIRNYEQYKYIYENQQNVITAFDIYNTIIYENKS